MSKHTPGPWIVDETVALGAYGVWTDYATHPGHDGSGYGSQICSVVTTGSELPREQRDANARLIASAPDLLAACEAVLNAFDADDDLATVEAAKLARAAIARATGGEVSA